MCTCRLCYLWQHAWSSAKRISELKQRRRFFLTTLTSEPNLRRNFSSATIYKNLYLPLRAGKMLSASYLQCHAACSRAVFPSKCMCAHSICIAFIPHSERNWSATSLKCRNDKNSDALTKKWINQYRVWRIVELSSGVANCNTPQGPNGLWNG